MEDDILELKEKIRILEKRIETIEKRELKRKVMTYVKSILISLAVGAASYLLWLGYRYVVNKINDIPNMLEEKVKEIDPIDTISGLLKK